MFLLKYKRSHSLGSWLAAWLAVGFFSCSQNDVQPTSILILGNSITHHGPLPKENWTGDWGMAATDSTKDYVHQLMGMLKARNPHITYRAINIAYWERDFNYRDMPVVNTPDILIIRLGENVPQDSLKTYGEGLKNLVKRYGFRRLIITGNFWANVSKDLIQESVAKSFNGRFISLKGLDADPTNEAINEYEPGSGIGRHPSDKGMYYIAKAIADKW